MIICSRCGAQNFDNASVCASCGASFVQPAAQPKKGISGLGKAAIVLGALIAVSIFLWIFIAEEASSAIDHSLYRTTDFDAVGYEKTVSDDEFGAYPDGTDGSTVEGEWRMNDGSVVLYITEGLSGSYYAESEILSFIAFEQVDAPLTMRDVEKNTDHFSAIIEVDNGFTKHEYNIFFNDKMMIIIDEDIWIVLYRGGGEYNVDLGKQLAGEWKNVNGKGTFVFGEDGTGQISGSSRLKITDWYVLDSMLYMNTPEGYDMYYIDLDGDELSLYNFMISENNGEYSAEWYSVDLERK